MIANICVYDPVQGQGPGVCRQWFSSGVPGAGPGDAPGGDGAGGAADPHGGLHPPG